MEVRTGTRAFTLRSQRPGVDIKQGDFLLAINGKPCGRQVGKCIASLKERLASVSSSRLDRKRTAHWCAPVVVEPIADEGPLRNRAWVERNLHLG